MPPVAGGWGGTSPFPGSGTARPRFMHRRPHSATPDLPELRCGLILNLILFTFFCRTGYFLTAVINLSGQISVLAFRTSFTRRSSTTARAMGWPARRRERRNRVQCSRGLPAYDCLIDTKTLDRGP